MPKTNHYIIAIDGPVGSGKSTIAKTVAQKLNFYHLDTGAMYRAVAWYLNSKKVNLDDSDRIKSILQKLSLDIQPASNSFKLLINNVDLSLQIRTPIISELSSKVAQIPEVRIKLVRLQRKIAQEYSIVVEGRDIGTIVFPNADLKIFLTATLEERAKRRFSELKVKEPDLKLNDVIQQVSDRDYKDSNRLDSPLKRANDAILLDSTNLTINQVVKVVVERFKEKATK